MLSDNEDTRLNADRCLGTITAEARRPGSRGSVIRARELTGTGVGNPQDGGVLGAPTRTTAEAGRLMTAADLADRWSVSEAFVYRLAREGKLPTVHLGRYRRFRLDAIDAFETATDLQ
jgi:excisionase family DNA binding protein